MHCVQMMSFNQNIICFISFAQLKYSIFTVIKKTFLADENVLTKLLEFASSEMIKADVDFILAWNFKFSPSSKAFKKCSYFPEAGYLKNNSLLTLFR